MAWPLQGKPWKKLDMIVGHLIFCFTFRQALEDGKHDLRQITTDEDCLNTAAEEYGITNIEIYKIL